MAVPEPSVIVVTQSNLPTKRHPWQSYYVDLGEPQGDYVGQDYRQEHSPPTPAVGAFRNRNSPPYEPLFYLHHRVPLIYSGTTVNTKAVSPHFLFPRYEVWQKLLGILSASTFKHFVIIVLTVFLHRRTQLEHRAQKKEESHSLLNLCWQDDSVPYTISYT